MYNENNTEILTLEEVAEWLQIGRNGVYALLQNGELKGFKIGTRWKVPRAALNEYIYKSCNRQK